MTIRTIAVCVVGTVGILLAGDTLRAQSQLFTGYLQTVPLWSGSTALTESNLSHFNRFRISTEPVFGTISVGAAYEHVATFRRRDAPAGIGVGAVPSGGEWLELQGDHHRRGTRALAASVRPPACQLGGH